MKSKSILLISLVSILLFVFSGCAKDTNTEKTDTLKPQTNKTQTQNASDASNASDGAKYANAEVYEKKGTPHAKTDDGQEVELTGENLQKLVEDYQKVQGTGSKEEKDLLNKIQLILEAPRE